MHLRIGLCEPKVIIWVQSIATTVKSIKTEINKHCIVFDFSTFRPEYQQNMKEKKNKTKNLQYLKVFNNLVSMNNAFVKCKSKQKNDELIWSTTHNVHEKPCLT